MKVKAYTDISCKDYLSLHYFNFIINYKWKNLFGWADHLIDIDFQVSNQFSSIRFADPKMSWKFCSLIAQRTPMVMTQWSRCQRKHLAEIYDQSELRPEVPYAGLGRQTAVNSRFSQFSIYMRWKRGYRWEVPFSGRCGASTSTTSSSS